MNEIDSMFYIHSDRIDVTDEKRIGATKGEAAALTADDLYSTGPSDLSKAYVPNFTSEIFYLCIAMSHYGPLKTITTFNCVLDYLGLSQKSLGSREQDKWRTGPPQQLETMAPKLARMGIDAVSAQAIMFQDGLTRVDLVTTSINFFAFVATWLSHQIHPHRIPSDPVAVPSWTRNLPMAIRILPLYIVEDIMDYFLCSVRMDPTQWQKAGRSELLTSLLPLVPPAWFARRGIPMYLDIKDVIAQSILHIVSRSRR